ncbi:MAG: 4-(cytidine 5'-diphospho)-2-C-methyl-D-erythritol kinase [Flavitalea sp.]
MIVFPNCKINLGLNITRKRPDGYHDLETVFYPLPLQDILEVIQDQNFAGNRESSIKILSESGIQKDSNIKAEQTLLTSRLAFTQSGLPISGDSSTNLCVKAYNLLKAIRPELPATLMHLHKVIPMGAGLGGGSSDGTFALKLLNDKYQLGLSELELSDLALQLGSDCPFFVLNKPCLAKGRGEMMEPLKLDLSNYHFVLIHPGIHLSTAAAFAGIKPAPSETPLETIISKPIGEWKDLLTNDFEKPVFKLYPVIEKLKGSLYEMGALYASMSGSGSSLYGIFEHQPDVVSKELQQFDHTIL